MPGMTPARNSFEMEFSVIRPYIIKPMLGGIMKPIVPPAATVAAERLSSYFILCISG